MSVTLARRYKALLAQAPPKKRTILDSSYRRRPVLLFDQARIGGLLIIAPSGWGKSILLGRHFALSDYLNELPQIIIDVGGQTIENFLLSCIYCTDPAVQQELLRRVVYVDMAARDGFVSSWSMLYPRSQNERLFITASRLPELLGQLDENFANATIQGLTRAIPIATMTGKILTALELPITAVFSLLRKPEQWVDRVTEAKQIYPEVTSAADDFFEYLTLSRRTREERVEPFLNRLNLLRHDEVAKAQFATPRAPTIDFDQVSKLKQTVLIDLSGEKAKDARQFKLLSVLQTLLEYLESRGRGVPFSVLIDELTYFVRGAAHTNTHAIAEKFRELIEQRMRNNSVYLTLATQDLKQIPPEMLTACLNLKSFLFGAQSDPETAKYLADRFILRDPWEVKYWERVWATEQLNGLPQHVVIDYRPIFLPLEESLYLNSREFMSPKLQKGTWLFAQSTGEGELATSVRRITTRQLFEPPFASDNKHLIQKLRWYLARRDGIPLGEVLEELAALEQAEGQQVPVLPEALGTPPQPPVAAVQGNGQISSPPQKTANSSSLQQTSDEPSGNEKHDVPDFPMSRRKHHPRR